MPREIVLSHDHSLCDANGIEIAQERQTFVQVSWSREAEYVQVVTGERNSVTHESESDTWWYATLERREINDLIRLLRRARDQAFGRDE